VYVGECLPEVKTVGDMVDRLDVLMNVKEDNALLEAERQIRGCQAIDETSIKVKAKILVGDRSKPMKHLVHFFPHTGFNVTHLETLLKDYPQIDTLLATISRVYPGNDLIAKAEELGLNFICGNSHAMEIYENGIPLAQALKNHLPELDVMIFRERMSSIPLESVGSPEIREYGKTIASTYLKRK